MPVLIPHSPKSEFVDMNYRDYRTVFQNFVLQPWNGVKSFSMSDDDRTMTIQQSATYPMLQLDTPSFRPEIKRGGTGKKIYLGEVAIIGPSSKDGWAEQDALLDELEPEMDALISYLDYHRKLSWGTITDIGTAYPIKRWENDNLWGWGVSITIETKFSFCHQPEIDVAIAHLYPVWTDGETELNLDIQTENFSTSWTKEEDKKRSITALYDQINAVSGTTNIRAEVFLETLILIHTIADTPISLNAELAGHSWKKTEI